MKQMKLLALILVLLCCLSGNAQEKLTQQQKWEQKVLAYEKSDSLNPPTKGIILFTGSSTIENWKTLKQDFPGRNVINRGISGTKTDDLLYYADRVIKPYKAKQIFLYEGDNDIGLKRTPEQVVANFELLFNKIRSYDSKVEIVFISIKPSPRRLKDSTTIEKANALIKDFLKDKKKTAYADVYYPMLNADRTLVPEYYREDGLHLTEAGYRIWVNEIGKYIK